MNSETLLLRQVHPNFVEKGHVSSQAFTPFPKDEGLLSVYDGDQISAAGAYKHYTEKLQFQSAGVWSVTVAESHQVGLSARLDPRENFPEHAVIDFTDHSPKSIRKLAKKLREAALARGCLHTSESE